MKMLLMVQITCAPNVVISIWKCSIGHTLYTVTVLDLFDAIMLWEGSSKSDLIRGPEHKY